MNSSPSHVAYLLFATGCCLLLVGLVVANRAVLKMADALNVHYKRRAYRWYNVIGAGASTVIREYGVGQEKRQLRSGYAMIAAGLALMALPGLIRKVVG